MKQVPAGEAPRTTQVPAGHHRELRGTQWGTAAKNETEQVPAGKATRTTQGHENKAGLRQGGTQQGAAENQEGPGRLRESGQSCRGNIKAVAKQRRGDQDGVEAGNHFCSV